MSVDDRWNAGITWLEEPLQRTGEGEVELERPSWLRVGTVGHGNAIDAADVAAVTRG